MTRALLVLLPFLFAAGCVSDPDVTVLDWDDPARSHEVPLTNRQQRPAKIESKTLTVDAAVRIAQANNPEIGQAVARVRRATALITRAWAPFLPSVDVGARVKHYVESGSAFTVPSLPSLGDIAGGRYGIQRGNELYTANADVTWNLFAGGRDYQNLRSAQLQERAAFLQVDRVKQQIDNAVRQAFYLILLADESIEIAKASVAFSSRELKDANARFKVGRGLKTDVLTFETRKLDAQVQQTEAENAYRLAGIALGELMALALPADLELVMPDAAKDKWEKMDEAQVVRAAWSYRSDLRAVRRQYAAAKRGIEAAKAGFWPLLTASAGYSNAHRNSPDFRKADDDVTGALAVQWNLFNGGNTVGAIAEARHNASEIAERYRQLKLSVHTEVSNALSNIRTARDRVELGEKTVTTAEETLHLLTERYRAGAITISQVTEGELRLTEARQQLIKAKIDLLQAQSELKLAIGVVALRE